MDIIFSDPQSNEEMLERLKEMCFLLGFVFFAGAAANTGRIYMMQTSGTVSLELVKLPEFYFSIFFNAMCYHFTTRKHL